VTLRSDRRLESRADPLLTEKLVYNVGPQHPSFTAPVRLMVQADGELIERVTPEIGYMHRGVEYLAQHRTYAQCAGLISRCEWLAGMNGDYLVAAAVEELAAITVPERAQWLRTLVLELSRLASHIFWFGDLGLEVGAITPIFWALREREGALDLLELLSGHRWHHGWIVPGGVRREPPPEFWPRLDAWLAVIEREIDNYEDFFSDNAIWVNRSELVGTLDVDYALARGASGPVLRACGVSCDLRRDAPYAAYDKLAFDIPAGEFGDSLDRYRVRFVEMRESLKLIHQCLGGLPGGAVRNAAWPLDRAADVPAGNCYVAVESPRGELGLRVISEGGPCPARLHLRAPSLYHMFLLDELCRGYLLADLFVIYASLDIMIGEVDR
jgi:NADH:ubiquinone oxidoreductase subunit D